VLDLLGQNLILQDFVTLFLGLIVEAFPFVVLGVTVSALVGVFVTPEWVVKLVPKNTFVSHVAVAFLGVLMPVCECGNVPVVRRLMLSGFKVSQAITFLLAAPIVNPITLWSTAEAFGWQSPVVYVRLAAAVFIAIMVGLVFSRKKNEQEVLTAEFYEDYCEHDHGHGSRLERGVTVFYEEFVLVMRALVIGAVIAAASQSFIPREIISGIGTSPILSIVAMLVLAFVISICANVDAFFALSYANTFTLGSLVSFLVFGPMIDIKMMAMLRTTFRAKALLQITALVGLSSLVVGLLVNYFY
jgi:uncharacterized membrane protein YraQ (UPF0718 family)